MAIVNVTAPISKDPFYTKPLKEYQAEIGIKGFVKGYICRDYKFKIGQTHSITNKKKIKLCQNGFHSVELVSNIEEFYSLYDHNHVFAIVKQWGTIHRDDKKKCSKHIKIVKYLKRAQALKLCILEKRLLQKYTKEEVKPIMNYFYDIL